MIQIFAAEGMPEVVTGDDIAALKLVRVSAGSTTGVGSITALRDGDVVVVASKIVSKAEGRSVRASDREGAITFQTVRVVATRCNTRIVENPL